MNGFDDAYEKDTKEPQTITVLYKNGVEPRGVGCVRNVTMQ